MGIEEPEHYDMAYLVSHMNDKSWASFVASHHPDILEDFSPEEVPIASAALAYPLVNKIVKMEPSNESFELNMCLIDITRYGISYCKYSEIKDLNQSNRRLLIGVEGDLYRLLGKAMVNCGRYSSALHYLDEAGKLFKSVLLFPDISDSDVRDTMISYEMSRADEALVYLQLIPVVSDDEKRLMATFAHSYLDHAISNLITMGAEEYESYSSSYKLAI